MPMVVRSLNRAAMPGSATRCGVQLLIDVSLDADRTDPLDIARPRSEGDTVEHVDDGLVSGLVSAWSAASVVQPAVMWRELQW